MRKVLAILMVLTMLVSAEGAFAARSNTSAPVHAKQKQQTGKKHKLNKKAMKKADRKARRKAARKQGNASATKRGAAKRAGT